MKKKLSIEQGGPILHIEDEPADRDSIKNTLADFGLSVISLDSGNHALRYIQNQPWNWYPWLVITDIVMGGMGGYQLMRRIQEYYPKRRVPFVVVSKLSGTLDVAEAEVAGAEAYLAKPVKPNQLVFTIKKLTDPQHKQSPMLVSIPLVRSSAFTS